MGIDESAKQKFVANQNTSLDVFDSVGMYLPNLFDNGITFIHHEPK